MATPTPQPGSVPCPDPSVHEHQHRLSEQASTAALYVTHPERATEVRTSSDAPVLGPDGKLSSKSAATSLKYANAQDLPSFPSAGMAANGAGKAALLAKDYKMKELWQPELSAAGSKAALLAHGKGAGLDLWQPSASADGNSAATLAMRNKSLSPQLDQGYTPEGKARALLAATMSHKNGLQRAGTVPPVEHPAYPDSKNSAANALSAATASHRTSTLKSAPDGWSSEANQAARVKNLHMDANMFGERPPVEIEQEEARHNAALRASAVSMAKTMYDPQNKVDHTGLAATDSIGAAGAEVAVARQTSAPQTDLKQEALRYIHLQEAAHKLASERLAKVDKNFEAARYREYYGYGDEDKNKRLSNRLSIRSKSGRKGRGSTDDAELEDSDDEEQARRIRNQMSQLNSGLSKVDAEKQRDDRAKLLAAAEKRVSARMHDMDERVFLETGKVSPAMMEEWEEKARQRAAKEREQQALNPGKTHIGGGKYIDQSEIEAIAMARLKPTLDEINDNAEKRRARDEELRIEREEQERLKREEKAKRTEEKEEQKRTKNEEKAAAKKEKEEEKARKTEQKRLAQDDKRKSREIKHEGGLEAGAATAAGATLAEVADGVKHDTEPATGTTTEADGVQKHRSALSRLKERFRKSGAPEHENDEKTTTAHTSHTPAAVAAALAGGATGAAIGTVAQPVSELDSQQASHAVEADKEPVDTAATATEPVEQTAVHDTAPVTTQDPVLDEPAHAPVATSSTAPAIAATNAPALALPIQPASEGHETSDATTETARPAFQQTPSIVGYTNDVQPTPTLQAKPDLERHISQIPMSDDDDLLDTDDEDLYAGAVEAAPTAAAISSAAPATTSTATAHDTPSAAAAPVSTTAPTDAPTTTTSTVTETAPTSFTAATSGTETAAAPPSTTSNTTTTAPVTKDPKAGKTTSPDTVPATVEYLRKTSTDVRPTSTSQSTESPEKNSKGLRGLFSKLRPRTSSKATTPEPSAATTAPVSSAAAPTTATTTTTDAPATHAATTAPVAATALPTEPETTAAPESPSSFKRHEASGPADLDDVSSSGADEDDLSRGRGDPSGKRTLTTTAAATSATAGASAPEADEADEQFEEARDHFDESLVPPPAFAGQLKSHSPVRETKFQEEL